MCALNVLGVLLLLQVYYLSPFAWAVRAMCINEMTSPAWSAPSAPGSVRAAVGILSVSFSDTSVSAGPPCSPLPKPLLSISLGPGLCQRGQSPERHHQQPCWPDLVKNGLEWRAALAPQQGQVGQRDP